jgi:hypothetical protein
MSGERPSPLWPEGISKVRPVGKQKTEALPKGASAPVVKQPELSKPGEQPVQQPGGTLAEANGEENLNIPPTEQAKRQRRRRAGSLCRGV